MPLSWIAAEVRGRLLSQHRLGRGGALELARSPSLSTALERLSGSAYRSASESPADLERAQRAVVADLLWNLRVLAGWLPAGGAEPLRALAGWFEIENVRSRLAYFAGGEPPEPFDPGSLATAGRRINGAASAGELRRVLAGSRWGDPGGQDAESLLGGMREAWYGRVRASVPEAATWADAAHVIWAARRQGLPGPADRPPRRVAWVLDGITGPELLWRAEAAWWRRVEQDALGMRGRWDPGSGSAVATAALLAVDAWRVRAALAAAAGGGDFREAFDAVA